MNEREGRLKRATFFFLHLPFRSSVPMRRFFILILTLVLIPGMRLSAQKQGGNGDMDKPLRVEIQARSVNETYRVIPCGTNGLILFFRSQEITSDARTNWYFTCYDTNFQQKWVKSVLLFSDQDFRFKEIGQDTLVLLFVHTGKSKDPENPIEILRVSLRNGTMILNTGKLENGSTVDFFGLEKGRAWLGVNMRSLAGKIMTIELKHGINRVFPLGTGSQLAIHWLKPDTASVTVSAIVSRQISKKIMEYYLVRYDTSGLIKREVLIGMQNGERAITQVRVVTSNNGSELLVGSYGLGLTTTSQKNSPVLDESTGFFSSQVKGGVVQTTNFYNFLELKNVNSIVGENDIINLKKKALKKKKSLSEYSLDYSVLMHDVIEKDGFLTVAAEFYTPQYHTESFTDFDFYGRPYTNSYSVFDGYRFFNTVVAGFDLEGKLLWDNFIEMRNLVSFELSPKVVIYPSGADLVLGYISDGKIGSRIIQAGNVVEKLDFSALDMLNPDDKLTAESKGSLIYWYGPYFLSSGYQEIKNIALESNNKRFVFYFSKLKFEK